MRGRLQERVARSAEKGTTPAHAGKTTSTREASTPASDHPRACGEDVAVVGDVFAEAGPPPRMRGRPHRQGRHRLRRRTTPAHAGKTRSSGRLLLVARDHPRACGEDLGGIARDGAPVGPPPRMRGRLVQQLQDTTEGGTTPAHAGKTDTFWPAAGLWWDHPRACGEDSGTEMIESPNSGPPPRMRGRLDQARQRATDKGTTPAHAGKTTRR